MLRGLLCGPGPRRSRIPPSLRDHVVTLEVANIWVLFRVQEKGYSGIHMLLVFKVVDILDPATSGRPNHNCPPMVQLTHATAEVENCYLMFDVVFLLSRGRRSLVSTAPAVAERKPRLIPTVHPLAPPETLPLEGKCDGPFASGSVFAKRSRSIFLSCPPKIHQLLPAISGFDN